MREISQEIYSGIVTGGVGGFVAGLSVWAVGIIRDKYLERKDKKTVYKWLRDNTEDVPGKVWRSTRTIASYTNLTDDRVVYIASIHKKIRPSTGGVEHMWGLREIVDFNSR